MGDLSRFNPARATTENQPDGESVKLPQGEQHHDELANTDPDNHGADTSAPVRENVPQPYGWSSASETVAADAQTESSGEPLIAPAVVEDVNGRNDSAVESDEQTSSKPGSKRSRKR